MTNTNSSLFSTQPTISSNWHVDLHAGANANGSATVTVQIHDNGGTANGGVDTSAAQTFTINVTAVNDAPSFTKGRTRRCWKTRAQSVLDWATAHLRRTGG